MQFDDRIFREITTIGPDEFLNHDSTEYSDHWDIYDTMRTLEAGHDPYTLDELDDETRDEIDDIEIYAIHGFDRDGLLWAALYEWYGGSRAILEHVRSAVDDRENGVIWFASGIGYDWIDSDLLDGDGSGSTRKRFIHFLNTGERR